MTRMRSEVVLFADPKLGIVSPSWRLRCCLEADGVAVFWFTPSRILGFSRTAESLLENASLSSPLIATLHS